MSVGTMPGEGQNNSNRILCKIPKTLPMRALVSRVKSETVRSRKGFRQTWCQDLSLPRVLMRWATFKPQLCMSQHIAKTQLAENKHRKITAQRNQDFKRLPLGSWPPKSEGQRWAWPSWMQKELLVDVSTSSEICVFELKKTINKKHVSQPAWLRSWPLLMPKNKMGLQSHISGPQIGQNATCCQS